MTNPERKPFGQRLISSMSEGLEKLREEKPLRTTFITVPPAPPEFRREQLVKLRTRYNMTQAAMAALVNVSEKTLESWEQGNRSPNGAALRLLQVIDEPEILARVNEVPTKKVADGLREAVEVALHRRERLLMALLLELVRTKPGLLADLYSDALGDATRMQQHAGALDKDQQDKLAELLPRVPKPLFIGKAKRRMPFAPLVKNLVQLGYLKAGQQKTTRVLRPTRKALAAEHAWLAWPVPGFTELVWAVSKHDEKKQQTERPEPVEV
jgi:DNA-binding transcriptional regulator YiaG